MLRSYLEKAHHLTIIVIYVFKDCLYYVGNKQFGNKESGSITPTQ